VPLLGEQEPARFQRESPRNTPVILILILVSNYSKKVDFVWLPSHIGIRGNELADKLANAATAKPSIDVNIGLEHSVRGIYLDRSIHSWQVATFVESGNQRVALQVSGKNGLHPGRIPPPIPAHRGHHRQMLLKCLPASDWKASGWTLQPLQ